VLVGAGVRVGIGVAVSFGATAACVASPVAVGDRGVAPPHEANVHVRMIKSANILVFILSHLLQSFDPTELTDH
jgi:hypothetical protein